MGVNCHFEPFDYAQGKLREESCRIRISGGRSAAIKARKALIHSLRFRGCETLPLEGAYFCCDRERNASNAAKEYLIKAFRGHF